MERYVAILNESEKAILKQLIGKTMNCILSPSISFELGADQYTLDVTASMEIAGSNYIVFSSLWQETKCGEAFWKINVKDQKVPDRIKYEIEEERVIGYSGNMSMISVSSKVESIVIYTVNKSYENEQMYYDSAVVFKTEKGQDICITSSSIPNVLALTWNKEKIANIVQDCDRSHVFR